MPPRFAEVIPGAWSLGPVPGARSCVRIIILWVSAIEMCESSLDSAAGARSAMVAPGAEPGRKEFEPMKRCCPPATKATELDHVMGAAWAGAATLPPAPCPPPQPLWEKQKQEKE